MTEEERRKKRQELREKLAIQIGNTPDKSIGRFFNDATPMSLEERFRLEGKGWPSPQPSVPDYVIPPGLSPAAKEQYIWEYDRLLHKNRKKGLI
jgi:hypothetical protein